MTKENQVREGALRWRVLLVVSVVMLSVGLCLGFFLGPSRVPGVAESPQEEAEIATPTIEFRDPLKLPASATLASVGQLLLSAGGTVTHYSCSVGGSVASGSSFVSLNEVPILALYTEVPLWRDLGEGSKGSDVAALQAELARLGYQVPVSGTWNSATTAAMKQTWKALDVSSLTNLPRAQVLWLPAQKITIKDCPLSLGQSVTENTAAASANDSLSVLQVNLEGGTAGGAGAPVARVAVLPAARVELPADGKITDATFLQAYTETGVFRSWSANPENTQLTVQTELKEPLQAITVPAGSLYDVEGAAACVLSGSQGFLVDIVSAELGQTTVTASEGKLPATVKVYHGEDAPSCR